MWTSIKIQLSNFSSKKKRWVSLESCQANFLSSYLSRNLVHFQTNNQKQKDSCMIMEKVVAFVVEVYKLINNQIVKYGFNEHTMSPLSFMNLAFGVEPSERWFIQLWNYTVLPYLNDMVKMKLIVSFFFQLFW